MPKYIKVEADMGYEGTEETTYYKVPNNFDFAQFENEIYEELKSLVSVFIEEIEKADMDSDFEDLTR